MVCAANGNDDVNTCEIYDIGPLLEVQDDVADTGPHVAADEGPDEAALGLQEGDCVGGAEAGGSGCANHCPVARKFAVTRAASSSQLMLPAMTVLPFRTAAVVPSELRAAGGLCAPTCRQSCYNVGSAACKKCVEPPYGELLSWLG